MQRQEALLEYPDDRQPVTKIGDVNNAIKEIIGLDRKQFSQIAMLAQGEFRKLLLSSTDEKQKIFRDIFSTESYGMLQERLKRNSLNLRDSYEEQRRRIAQHMEQVSCQEEYARKEELEAFCQEGQLTRKEEFDDLLADILLADESALKGCDEQLGVFERQLEDVNRKLGIVKERKQAREELDKTEKQLLRLKEEHDMAVAMREQAEKEYGECEAYSKDVVLIQEQLPNYRNYSLLQKELQERQKELGKLEQRMEDVQQSLKEYRIEEKELSVTIEQTKDAEKKQLLAHSELLEKQEKQRRLEELAEQQHNVKALQMDYDKALKEYQKLSTECGEKMASYQRMETAFYDAQAGIIAREKLVENMPCPVCGSLEHPSPAKVVDAVATKEELDAQKELLELARKEVSDVSERAGRLDEQRLSAWEIWKSQKELLYPEQEISEEMVEEDKKALAKTMTKLASEIQVLEGEQKRYEEASKKLPKIQEHIEEARARLQELESLLVKGKAEFENGEARKKELGAGFRFESEQAAKLEIDRLNNEIKRLTDGQRKAQNAVVEIEKQQKEQEGRKQSILRQLEHEEPESELSLVEQRNDWMERRKHLQQEKDTILVRYQQNSQAQKLIDTDWKQFGELNHRYQIAKLLSDTANGELTGRDKVKLETYIQTAYFDRVLERANVRLMGMTSGQYELVRRKESGSLKSQSGLELDVKDHYIAAVRPVQSLSGGETFMASLALALGLASEISETAGGIRLDTLFVDEGFGSLDDETLSRAMKELNQLTEGNRLVGIISHVAELKNWIDKQLVVKKDAQTGSFVELVM